MSSLSGCPFLRLQQQATIRAATDHDDTVPHGCPFLASSTPTPPLPSPHLSSPSEQVTQTEIGCRSVAPSPSPSPSSSDSIAAATVTMTPALPPTAFNLFDWSALSSTISPQQIQTVVDTAPVLKQNGVALTKHFYARLLSHHPELKNQFSVTHQATSSQAIALASSIHAFAVHLPSLPNNTAMAEALLHIVHKHGSVGVRAEQYPIVGRHLLASIQEVLQLPADSPIVTAWTSAYELLSSVLSTAETKLQQQLAAQPGGWLGFRKFTIVNIQRESDEISSFYLAPLDSKTTMQESESVQLPTPATCPLIHAGQYVGVRVWLPKLGVHQIRQYTLTEFTQDSWRITVKRDNTDTGVSKFLHEQEVGAQIDVTMPFGNFTLNRCESPPVTTPTPVALTPSSSSSPSAQLIAAVNENSSAPLVFVCAGIGITPIYSMLQHILSVRSSSSSSSPASPSATALSLHHRPLYVLHCARNSNTVMKRAVDMLRQSPHITRFVLFFSQPTDNDVAGVHYDIQGRISWSHETVQELNRRDSVYFVCGPTEFIESVQRQLTAVGVSTSNIHAELFSKGRVAF